MTANIYIFGQIGSNGPDSKGVELVDVVEQVAKYKDANPTQYDIHINSPGGSVNVGHAIAEYISTLPNAYTIAEGMCASIATEVHLAVPVQNRKVQEGTIYMIHNPLFQNISGNAEELMAAAEELKGPQKDLVDMYVKATGLTKGAVAGMMNQETHLTPEQCVTMGFASEITSQYKAVAFLDNNQSNNNAMDKKEFNGLRQMMAAIGAKLKLKVDAKGLLVDDETATSEEETDDDPNEGRNPVALMLETDDGKTLETPFDDIMIGDPVTMDGEPAPDGTYTMTDGMVIVVAGGAIETITPAADGDLQTVLAANATLKAENDTLKAQLSEQAGQIEEMKAGIEIINKKMTTSSFVPKGSPVAIRQPKGRKPEAQNLATEAEEREKLYKSKK